MNIARRLPWYWHRLRVMSAAEVLSRCASAMGTGQLYLAYLNPQRAIPTATHAFATARQSVFAHRLRFDAVPDAPPAAVPADQDWHTAPDTGRVWPRRFFASVDHRAGNAIGDARLTWERSRLQQLVDEALRYRQARSQERRRQHAESIIASFSSWRRANPYLCGIHYVSAMECALRVIALTTAFDIIREDVEQADWHALADLVSGHAALIYRRMSTFSSAGNHTVAEAAGLICAGVLYPSHAQAHAWRERGRAHLEHELLRQILPDGGGIEQASGYLRFIVELGFISDCILQSDGGGLSTVVRKRIETALGFLDALRYSATGAFQFGDDDGGRALSRHLVLESPATISQTRRLFPHAGATRIDHDSGRSGRQKRMQLWFQHNPMGMPPLFGHGHAGCLSLQLAVDGCPILIDCGTYGYNLSDGWRRYFRGTSAHNTVCVDASDQSEQIGNFQWARDLRVRLIADWMCVGGVQVIIAAHHGYESRGVMHYRALLFSAEHGFAVWDHLAGSGYHRASVNWHVAGPCGWTPSRASLALGGTGLMLVPPSAATTVLHYRSSTPCAGWQAPGYGRLEGIHTITSQLADTLPFSALTRFEWIDSASLDNPVWQDALQQLEATICT